MTKKNWQRKNPNKNQRLVVRTVSTHGLNPCVVPNDRILMATINLNIWNRGPWPSHDDVNRISVFDGTNFRVQWSHFQKFREIWFVFSAKSSDLSEIWGELIVQSKYFEFNSHNSMVNWFREFSEVEKSSLVSSEASSWGPLTFQKLHSVSSWCDHKRVLVANRDYRTVVSLIRCPVLFQIPK